MATTVKISALPSAATLTGAELVEVVQSGANVKTTAQDIADLGGGGGSGILTPNYQSGNYTTVLSDVGKMIRHRNGAGHTYTIGPSDSVAYEVGSCITFVNYGGDDLSIRIDPASTTADTLILAGTATTGTRTLTQNGVCTAVKVQIEETGGATWIISGAGLS